MSWRFFVLFGIASLGLASVLVGERFFPSPDWTYAILPLAGAGGLFFAALLGAVYRLRFREGRRRSKGFKALFEFDAARALSEERKMTWGLQNRLSRIIRPTDGHTVMLAADHGYFLGPTHKLEIPRKTLEPLLPYADAVMVTRGVVRTSIDPGANDAAGDHYRVGVGKKRLQRLAWNLELVRRSEEVAVVGGKHDGMAIGRADDPR